MRSIIKVDEDKCINCHQCIAVCPVKFCQDGSKDYVEINHDWCIGCGSCIDACRHDARKAVDDWDSFSGALNKREKIIAIIAPAAAVSFQGNLLKLNGLLQSLGITACFDVSFGAELTVFSYLQYIKNAKPEMVISQPCPVVVNYIERYQPELLKYLAPVDSPMLHTIKMIERYYPQYRSYKIAAISPCLAKGQEFEATGKGDYNISFLSLEKYLEKTKRDISSFPEVPYANPPAERAVLFSSPGGLKATLEREVPELMPRVRKVEGIHSLYDYFEKLPAVLNKGFQPLVVDCLNCIRGCNGGTGTGMRDAPEDLLEGLVDRRAREMKKVYSSGGKDQKASKKINKVLADYWEPDLYKRLYKNRSGSINLKTPGKDELWKIYNRMQKFSEKDLYHCASCGYGDCEKMANAIFNGLNKPENCHHYQISIIEKAKESVRNSSIELESKIVEANQLMGRVVDLAKRNQSSSAEQVTAVQQSSSAIDQMVASIRNVDNLVQDRQKLVSDLQTRCDNGIQAMGQTLRQVMDVSSGVEKIQEVNKTIDNVAANTNLLAMNAAIEAAHAGNAGVGFAVVASEIRNLAEETANNAHIIAKDLTSITGNMSNAKTQSQETNDLIKGLVEKMQDLSISFRELVETMNEMSVGTTQVQQALAVIQDRSQHVDENSRELDGIVDLLNRFYGELKSISESSATVLAGQS